MLWLPLGASALSTVGKIPLLFSSAYLVHRASTPPTPPATKSSTIAYGGKQDLMSRSPLQAVLTAVFKTVHWVNAITESAIIIASRYPTHLYPRLLQHLVHEPDRDVSNIRITPMWLSGCLFLVVGSLIRLSCYHTLGRLFTWDLTIKDDHRLATEGPYAIVRHPSYLGSVMIGLGTMLCHLGRGSWFVSYGGFETVWGKCLVAAWSTLALFPPTILIRRVGLEDKVLQERFGDQWVTYARRTRYRLIPYIF